ncbi:MAG: exosortase K, partial [Desulfobulbaceae bacterium]|nr:exosortase K [Desulfobulbaceae bacterium]
MKLITPFVKNRQGDWGNILLLAVVLSAAYGLKYHFSVADSDELAWMLAPLAWVVEVLSDNSFHAESGAGYVSSDGLIIIAPVCAGINFLIALLLTGASIVLLLPCRFGCTVIRLVLVVVTAYLFTIIINGLRITLAIELYGLDIYGSWFTAERLHRAAGIFLYFPALLSYGLLVQGLLAKRPPWHVIGCCLFWYLGLSLGVPLLTGSFREFGPLFYEHCFAIVIGCTLSIGGYFVLTSG